MENEIIANIKTLGLDMINNANSGHPGVALSGAPIIYTLYANHLVIKNDMPYWPNRDRLVLSAGHASALLYATLYMADFLTLNDLKQFRKIGSRTPGHPEYGKTPGVDVSTGPLGQGLASAVGMAIGEKKLETNFKIKDTSLIHYKVYVFCGDGDLMEGISYEAASLAGTLKLDNLIVLYDSNNISLDGSTDNTFTENVRERFEALGWETFYVKDGNKVSDIDKAITKAKKSEYPAFIEIKTILGNGSLQEGTNRVHGKPLDIADIQQIKQKLNIDSTPFYTNKKVKNYFHQVIMNRSNQKYEKWNLLYKNYIATKLNGDSNVLDRYFYNKTNLDLYNLNIEKKEQEELRQSNERVMNAIVEHTDNFIGGSADVASSTKTYLKNMCNFSKNNRKGKNILYGVREHSMGAISNGLALSGFRPFCSTFLAFSDYLKPAIRMSAIMKLPVTYIFTHDTILSSEDGPTHEPIEQISMLRNIPNFYVYRPADINEIIGSWQTILEKGNPAALIISKEKVHTLANSNPKLVQNGGYMVQKERNVLDAVIVTSGSEVALAVLIANELYIEGIDLRVVSMPCIKLYNKQSQEYKNKIIPFNKKVIVIEAAASIELRNLVYNNKYMLTLDKFGYSGTKEEVLYTMNFTKEQLKSRIKTLLK